MLAIPKINFLLGLLDVPNEIVIDLKEIIYRFIWKGKTRKLKETVLIQPFEKGGCNMIDIESTIKAEKVKWIKYYLGDTEGAWRNTMQTSVGVENLTSLLQGNYEISLLHKCGIFYKKVLKYWSEIKICLTQEPIHTSNQLIFYNKHITANGNMIFSSELFNAGIIHVRDLFMKIGGQIRRANFNPLNLTANTLFLVNSIITSIPRTWKNNIIFEQISYTPTSIPIKDEVLEITQCSQKQLKELWISKKEEVPTGQTRYNAEFDINELDWKYIYLRPKLLNFDNKIFETQFKIIHRYILTNRVLFKMKKIPSDQCNFCSLYSQSLHHLFFDCFTVRDFWFSVMRIFNITVNKQDVLLGNKDLDNQSNKILMYANHYIYNCKLNDVLPNINAFENIVNEYQMFM